MTSPDGHAPCVAHHLEEVMGTVVTIDLYSRAVHGPVGDLVQEACRILHRADDVFSTWKEGSAISCLRRGELALADAPPEVTDVLQGCAIARRLSGGWFDPWAMPGGVDPTGYVKGWAAQQALEALRRPDIDGAIVNAAGDLATLGNPSAGEPFQVGIVDPHDTTRVACVIAVDGAVATSGTYERGPHLVDPRTRRPEARLASATVCGPDLGIADALATALAVAGTPLLGVIQRLDGYEALAIDDDGACRWTGGFPFTRAPEDVTPNGGG